MFEFNSNFIFWKYLISREVNDIVLVSRNLELIKETIENYKSCLVIYSDGQELPEGLGQQVIHISSIENCAATYHELVVVDDIRVDHFDLVSNFVNQLSDCNNKLGIVIRGRNLWHDLVKLRFNTSSISPGNILSAITGIKDTNYSFYYSRWHNELQGYFEVDVVPADKPGSKKYIPHSYFRSLKSALLSKSIFNRLLPGFIFVNNAAHESIVHKIFIDVMSSIIGPGNACSLIRFITGNASVVIAVITCASDGSGYVVRIPNTHQGTRLCRNNIEALKLIGKNNFSFKVPEFILQSNDRNNVFVESVVQGREISIGHSGSAEITKNAFEVAREISQTGQETVEWNVLLDRQRDKLKQFLEVEFHEDIDRLTSLLKQNVSKYKHTCLVASHGDFKSGNFLFSPDLSICGVIDWDCFENEGLLLTDELSYLVYFYNVVYEMAQADVYLNKILPLADTDEHLDLLEKQAALYRLGPEEFLNYRIIFWFTHALSRFSEEDLKLPIYKFGALRNPLRRSIEYLQQLTTGNS